MTTEFSTPDSNGLMPSRVETEFGMGWSILSQKIARQRREGKEPVALFSDFDGTLYSGDISKTIELVNLAERKDIPVVVVTGRGSLALRELVDGFIADYNERHPHQTVGEINFDAIIGAVGTEIYIAVLIDGRIEYRKDIEYEQQLIKKGFVRSEIARKVAESVTELSGLYPKLSVEYQKEFIDDEKEYLAGHTDAKVQPFKISLNFYAKDAGEVKLIRRYFEDKFPTLRIVISQAVIYNSDNQEERSQYCLDILPVTKADAVDYLAQKAGIPKGIVAGDSGNDLSMLIDSKNLDAILVGGHKSEAREGIGEVIIDDHDRRGRRFQTISSDHTSNTGNKRVYIGENDNIGPDSIIIRVAEVYERAGRIKAIRGAISSSGKEDIP